jgi:serine protease
MTEHRGRTTTPRRVVHAAFALVVGSMIVLPLASAARTPSGTPNGSATRTTTSATTRTTTTTASPPPRVDVIVTLEEGHDVDDLVDDIAAAGLPLVVQEQITDELVVVARPGGIRSTTAIGALAGMPSVDVAERDPVVTTFAAPPNDAQWADLWGLDESPTRQGIGVLDAWDSTRGVPSVVVAVVDSGVVKHPDLKSLLPGWDFVEDDADTSEDDASCGGSPATFHGTHVAGTIGAAAGNRVGVAGVAPGVRLLPVRVNDHCGSGSGADLISGILWAAGVEVANAPLNPNPAKVINLSLGSVGACVQGYQDAIDTVVAQGVIVVAATGNAASAVAAPANCDGVIAVAAGQPDGSLAGFSNRGPETTITAPGTGVVSTYRNTATVWAPKKYGTGYAALNGTSMATPHVAGVVALVTSVDPGITAAEATTLLTATARAHPTVCSGCGAGLLDAGAAVTAATPTAGALWPRSGSSITLDAKVDMTWTAVDAARVTVEIVQNGTTLTLATASAAGGRASATLTSGRGIVAGAAVVRFTPSGSVAGRPVPAPFEVGVVVRAPAVRFVGPGGTLTYGVRSSITWAATGRTSATGNLFLVDRNNTATLLRAGVKAQSGSFSLSPPITLAAGAYNVAFQAVGGAPLATAYRTITIGTVDVTATLALTERTTAGLLRVTVRPGTVGAPVAFTVVAQDGASILRIGTVSTRAGAGAVTLKLPRGLTGRTVTFSVVPALIGISSTSCTVAVAGGASGACSSTPITF